MLLNNFAIGNRIKKNKLFIDPFNPEKLRAASYVLTLSNRTRRWIPNSTPIRLWEAKAADRHLTEISNDLDFTIAPGEFMLACTAEQIGVPADLYGIISPLSHIARFGLSIHCGADFINPGFGMNSRSSLVLELYNCNSSPLILTSGMPIAHIKFGRVDFLEGQPSPVPGSVYEGMDPLTPPRYYEEWSKKRIRNVNE